MGVIVGTLFYLRQSEGLRFVPSVGDWIHFERRLANMRLLRMKEFADIRDGHEI